MRYDILLLDADETLLELPPLRPGVPGGHLQTPSHPLWGPYAGALPRDQRPALEGAGTGGAQPGTAALPAVRPAGGALGVPVDSARLQRDYIAAMRESGYLLPGALTVCQELSRKYPLYLVTNGSTETQHSRVAGPGAAALPLGGVRLPGGGGAEALPPLFPAGVPGNRQPRPPAGADDWGLPTSDMAGGKGAGTDTCWLAPLTRPDLVGCTWRIQKLEELPALLARTEGA